MRIDALDATNTDVKLPPKNCPKTPSDGSCWNIETRTLQVVKPTGRRLQDFDRGARDTGAREVLVHARLDVAAAAGGAAVVGQHADPRALAGGIRDDLPASKHEAEIDDGPQQDQQERRHHRQLDNFGATLGPQSPAERVHRSHTVITVPRKMGMA